MNFILNNMFHMQDDIYIYTSTCIGTLKLVFFSQHKSYHLLKLTAKINYMELCMSLNFEVLTCSYRYDSTELRFMYV